MVVAFPSSAQCHCCLLGLEAKWGCFPILLSPLGTFFKINFFCYLKISYYAFWSTPGDWLSLATVAWANPLLFVSLLCGNETRFWVGAQIGWNEGEPWHSSPCGSRGQVPAASLLPSLPQLPFPQSSLPYSLLPSLPRSHTPTILLASPCQVHSVLKKDKGLKLRAVVGWLQELKSFLFDKKRWEEETFFPFQFGSV